jgi:hypothetical protein
MIIFVNMTTNLVVFNKNYFLNWDLQPFQANNV